MKRRKEKKGKALCLLANKLTMIIKYFSWVHGLELLITAQPKEGKDGTSNPFSDILNHKIFKTPDKQCFGNMGGGANPSRL